MRHEAGLRGAVPAASSGSRLASFGRTSLAIIAGIGLVVTSAALARIPNLVEAPGAFLLLFGAAFACYVAGNTTP